MVAKLGNLTEAATHLRITQASLSLAIQNLEQSVGVTLFERRRYGMTLTDEGERLYKSLLLIHAKIGDALESLHVSAKQRRIKIGAVEHIGSNYLYQILKRTPELFPRYQLYMHYSRNILEAVEQGKLDFGFITWTSRPKSVKYAVVAPEPLVIAGLKSRYGEIAKIKKVEQLLEYPWVRLPKPQLDWTEIFSDDQEAYMVGGLYSQRAAILGGMGIGEVHLRGFTKKERSSLAIAPVSSPHAGAQIYCVFRGELAESIRDRMQKLVSLLAAALHADQ